MYEKPKPVPDEEMAASYAVPTAVVNRFLISTEGGVPGRFRIAFGERMGTTDHVAYRVAVQMTPLEAFELKSILETLLKPFQEDIDAIIKRLDDGAINEG